MLLIQLFTHSKDVTERKRPIIRDAVMHMLPQALKTEIYIKTRFGSCAIYSRCIIDYKLYEPISLRPFLRRSRETFYLCKSVIQMNIHEASINIQENLK